MDALGERNSRDSNSLLYFSTIVCMAKEEEEEEDNVRVEIDDLVWRLITEGSFVINGLENCFVSVYGLILPPFS